MTLYIRINAHFSCAMSQPFSQIIKPYAVVAVLCVAVSMTLHSWQVFVFCCQPGAISFPALSSRHYPR